MSEHTPEPWRTATPDETGWFFPSIFDSQGMAVAECNAFDIESWAIKQANARRIVACVNACKGLPTESLENPEFLRRARLYARPLKDLDDAKALLRKLLAIHAMGHHDEVTSEAYPGAMHEEAEESLCTEARDFLAKSDREAAS